MSNVFIDDNKFNVECSTRTFIAKIMDVPIPKKNINDLLIILPGSKITKFRNCVITKIKEYNKKLCIKLYTNMTIQLNGIKTIEDIEFIFNKINVNYNYKVTCVMSNWSLKLTTDKLNLNQIMDLINSNENACLMAYFLRGYPLIIKHNTFASLSYYNVFCSPCVRVSKELYTELSKITVTVLLFSSGNCIVSGPNEKSCVNTVKIIKQYI